MHMFRLLSIRWGEMHLWMKGVNWRKTGLKLGDGGYGRKVVESVVGRGEGHMGGCMGFLGIVCECKDNSVKT